MTIKVDPHIMLRIRTKDEAKDFFAVIRKDKKHLAPWMPWANRTRNISEVQNFIAKKLEQFKKMEGCDFGIYYDDKIIGSAGYHMIDTKNKIGSIGYWIAKEYEGKGIVSRAVSKILELGKKKYRLHRLELRIDVKNKRSQAVARRLGFTYEGTLRGVQFRAGKFRNMEVWSLINK